MSIKLILRWTLLCLCLACCASGAVSQDKLWSLRPVVRPEIPTETEVANPIDAFLRQSWASKGLRSVGPADRNTLLRRVYIDLIGLPPSPQELQAFLQDSSPDAYEKVVDRLLASEQHGARYARHWLDVLRYSDLDNSMPAEPGLYRWRDWIISALNRDLSFDQFVRAQLMGDLSDKPDDVFATGFLARGAQTLTDNDQELAFNAVETVSAAFLGMTSGCARCHDHKFDPILQRDFYSMKALFDPLVLDRITLASADERAVFSRAKEHHAAQRSVIEAPLNEFLAPFRLKLREERIVMLPPDIQIIVRKPEKERTPEERKLAEDYAPILRIDKKKILETMSPPERIRYEELEKPVSALKEPTPLPVFWTVREDALKLAAKNYILLGGEVDKPGAEVQPGFPFAPAKVDITIGRRQAFLNWLTDPGNPLFARVAVNRIWQWHFGDGIAGTVSDFGSLGKKPFNPQLLDWLASEFVKQKFSMKSIHRLIVTSETYRMASAGAKQLMADNAAVDPANRYFSHFPVKRLEAEAIWDLMYAVSGEIDLSVGGKSFRAGPEQKYTGGDVVIGDYDARVNRRGIYMGRGFHGDAEMMPAFLQVFDAEDGRRPCPRRNRTVTAPQALTLMNSPFTIDRASQFAERLRSACGASVPAAVDLGYRIALSRPPSPAEKDTAVSFFKNDPKHLEGLAWMLLNLDEFIYQQ